MAKKRMDKPAVHFAQRSYEDLKKGDNVVTRIRRCTWPQKSQQNNNSRSLSGIIKLHILTAEGRTGIGPEMGLKSHRLLLQR